MVSVCIATYNGDKYLLNQLESILSQLEEDDEVIISDDSSSDKTEEILLTISSQDPRVKLLLKGKCHNPTYNFERSLRLANGDIIILSDQDDIWLADKVAQIKNTFKTNHDALCVLHNRNIIDSDGLIKHKNIILRNPIKQPFIKQLLKNPYIGCCMAFRKELLKLALPFPRELPMHDLWIGLLAAYKGKSLFVDKSLINYRRHGENVTTGKSPYSIWYRIYYRIRLYHLIKQRWEKYENN